MGKRKRERGMAGGRGETNGGEGGAEGGGGRAVKKIFGVKFSKICLGEEVAPSPSER